MYDYTCMETIHSNGFEWLSNEKPSREWEPLLQGATRMQLPSRAYSKRSAHIADLRANAEWSAKNSDDFIQAPSPAALLSAKSFINNLADGCLEFRLAISHSGEINFFFGEDEELFQILIDETGMLSYYAKTATEELGGSDIAPEKFHYLRLLQFVERKK